jgi:hypothetical protein
MIVLLRNSARLCTNCVAELFVFIAVLLCMAGLTLHDNLHYDKHDNTGFLNISMQGISVHMKLHTYFLATTESYIAQSNVTS